MTARLVNAQRHRHYLHVEKLAIYEQIFISERQLPNDVRDVTNEHTLVGLKLFSTSLLVDFTTKHEVLAGSLV